MFDFTSLGVLLGGLLNTFFLLIFYFLSVFVFVVFCVFQFMSIMCSPILIKKFKNKNRLNLKPQKMSSLICFLSLGVFDFMLMFLENP
jgi:hypothetical protein